MATYPGGSNTFVPSWDASGKLQIEFSRNPKSFAVNKYVAQRSVTKDVGYYLKITAEEAARIVAEEDFDWPDGADAVRKGGDTNDGLEKFEWLPYTTTRKQYPYNIGYKAAQQADFDVLALHGRIKAQQAMTMRTVKAISMLTTSGNYDSSNVGTATAVGGGVWLNSSASNNYILKTINGVKETINLATLGVVQPKHLKLVVNPNTAHMMRETPEVIDFVKQQVSSGSMLKGTEFFEMWGLPERLYGVQVVVEDCGRVTTRKGATKLVSYTMPDNLAVIVANTADVSGDTVTPVPGDGVPVFDTITNFLFEDMTVESMDDPDNRRHRARIVDDFGMVMTAPATGFLITNIQS